MRKALVAATYLRIVVGNPDEGPIIDDQPEGRLVAAWLPTRSLRAATMPPAPRDYVDGYVPGGRYEIIAPSRRAGRLHALEVLPCHCPSY